MITTEHYKLMAVAFNAIANVGNDTSVSLEQNLSSLEELREDIDVRIDALKQDIKDKVEEQTNDLR